MIARFICQAIRGFWLGARTGLPWFFLTVIVDRVVEILACLTIPVLCGLFRLGVSPMRQTGGRVGIKGMPSARSDLGIPADPLWDPKVAELAGRGFTLDKLLDFVA